MAISKNRLEELISKGSTVYTILQGGIEKVDLAKARIFGRTNDYIFIDYWCDTFDQYIETSNERLFETQKEAEWHLQYHATRTEYLDLPTWEEFKKDCIGEINSITFIGRDWETYQIYISPKGAQICLDDYCEGSFLSYKRWKATEENYIKACDLCLKLFKEN